MYMAETAPFHIRGAMISTYQLFITLGIFVAACINFGTNKHYHDTASWRIPMGIGFLWPLILGFGILLFPDTPRYDYRHGRVDRAKQTMMAVYGVDEHHWSIHKELEEIRAKLEAENASKQSWWREQVEMFTAPRMFYRISLGVLLQMFQQLTGANYFFYYGTLIFKGVEINPFVTQMILNGRSAHNNSYYGPLTSSKASTSEPHSSACGSLRTSVAGSRLLPDPPGCSSAS